MNPIALILFKGEPLKASHKVCRLCPDKGEQPVENFQRRPTMRDGYSNECKDCVAKADKERRDRIKRDRDMFNPF